MNTKKYIPKSKSDIKAVEYLKSLPFDTVRADVPRLLECIQDMHWDIGGGVADYLAPHVNEIIEELLSILDTNDECWKFNIIRSLIAYSPDRPDPKLIKIIRRIAEHPTQSELEDNVDYAAKYIIDNRILR